MKLRLPLSAVAIATVLALAAPAYAQNTATGDTPDLEVGVGYQFTHTTGDAGDSFPLGFAVDAAKRYRQFAIAGEFGWSRDSAEVPGVSISSSFIHFGVGPRLMIPAERFRPYVQFLLGLSHLGYSQEIGGIEDDDSINAFMIQPGGGVNISMGSNWGVFGDFAFRRSFFENDGSNQVRLYFGARFGM